MVGKEEEEEEGSLDLSLLSTGSIEWENFFFPSFSWLTRCPPFFCRLASILPQPDAPFPSSFPLFPGESRFRWVVVGRGWFSASRLSGGGKEDFLSLSPNRRPQIGTQRRWSGGENERTELRSGGRPTERGSGLELTLTAGSQRSA